MHLASRHFPMHRQNNLSISAWRPLLDSCGRSVNNVLPDLRDFLKVEIDFLEKHWPTCLPTGTCHADLFPDNVFFLNGKLSGLIDFYFACDDFLAYDLAICLNAWCFNNNGQIDQSRARLLINAYQKVRKLNNTELQAFPILARGGAMRFLLTRLFDWINSPTEALVKPKDPSEYFHILSYHKQFFKMSEYGF